jgi:hypothetical protein
MAQRVVLHIGAMKSGTSFIQNVLGHNKEHLAEQGVLFPGARWKAQIAAVRDLANGAEPGDDVPGAWNALCDEVNAWSGTAVISMEFLGPRSKAQIERAVTSFPGAQVEAVLSCRDLARQIPAMWLESVQNGSTTGWQEYLDAVRTEDRSVAAGKNFWRHQAIPAMARRWAGGLPSGALTVLTVPRPGAPSDLLWQRFGSIIGIDAASCDLDVRANPSIGLATAQVLLRLNRRMRKEDGSLPASYDTYVKHTLAKRGLVSRQGVEPRLGLDEAWVVKRGRAQVNRLRSDGHRVVGDLDELLPAPVPGIHADQVPTADELDAAIDGLAHMVGAWSTSERRKRRRARRAAAAQAEAQVETP